MNWELSNVFLSSYLSMRDRVMYTAKYRMTHLRNQCHPRPIIWYTYISTYTHNPHETPARTWFSHASTHTCTGSRRKHATLLVATMPGVISRSERPFHTWYYYCLLNNILAQTHTFKCTSSFFLISFSQHIKTYGVGRSFVISPKDLKKNELVLHHTF